MNKEAIIAYYEKGGEKNRLELDYSMLEGIRTREIISRFLPDHSIHILDAGGGTGFYSFWLKELGHYTTLIDLSPYNIEAAKEYGSLHNVQLDGYGIADATSLDLEDNRFDMVLMMGPLYHLIEKNDRIKALSEAKRVLKPGGILLAAVISRYASLLDGFRRNLISDEASKGYLFRTWKQGYT